MWIDELTNLLDGRSKIVRDTSTVERLSKDAYWYSPILYEELYEKKAECIVFPLNENEVQEVVVFAVKKKIPLTIRGSGTGNYGQAIPLEGGIVIDITKMDQTVNTTNEAVTVQAGKRLGVLEKEMRKQNKELRIFPSTFMKSTVSGFLCGGSGGIGSIRWGNLWDDNVNYVKIMTIEETPQILHIYGEEVLHYIHNYGTTGILLEAGLPLEEKMNWKQMLLTFEEFSNAVSYCGHLADRNDISLRLLSTCEWPLPLHYKPLEKYINNGESLVILETTADKEKIAESVQQFLGKVTYYIPAEKYQKGLKLSDFTWNHSTLWAHKNGENMTYLQARFDSKKLEEQIEVIKKEYQDEVQLHFEFIKIEGEVTPAALPVLKFYSTERIYEVIDFFERHGIQINNPHTYLLGFGGYNLRMDEIKSKKEKYDPHGLLNPGKIPKAKEII
ncbi:FAD-binding oxidoreductase [Marinococcus sp. PL1-022]|uniref:FAD-binding oxidoreductase n=1 Tax=Marinococcus sp. PL1-022 TaxID=3095363 RepID=UPI0029C37EBE|nr:FAD-binding oxidoreductase [Marinococcus sp. PL1-022]MDX6153494.1 FAD-binding oxidoreductase [Marinococcus sp. PL1-022]